MMLGLFNASVRRAYRIVRLLRDLRELEPLDLSSRLARVYILELSLDVRFWKYITRQITSARERAMGDTHLGGWIDWYMGMLIYAIIRLRKPDVVVETGIGPGATSALILNALSRNSKGTLYSIDLPGHDAIVYPNLGRPYNLHVPPGYSVGWMVPEWLKSRWRVIIGDAQEELPRLVSGLRIGVFLHDSLHTDDHVKFELETVLPSMEPDGLLLADDVNEGWSLAFVHWCNQREHPFIVLRQRLGIALV